MRIFVVLLVLASACGCGTVLRGRTEMVHFESTPQGATVTTSIRPLCDPICPTRNKDYAPEALDNTPRVGPTCLTPCSLEIARNESFTATFILAGYEPLSVPVETRTSVAGQNGVTGNVIAGGTVGLLVDAGTGAALDHFPNPVIAQLRPTAPAQRPKR